MAKFHFPQIGERYMLVNDVDRFPDFIAEGGLEGTLSDIDNGLYCLRMDKTIEGAEEWDNEVIWHSLDEFLADVRRLG